MYSYVISMAVKRGYVEKKYDAVAKKGYRGVLTKISLDADGMANITDICEGTNVADLNYYFARKRNVNDFHGLGAFLIVNEHFLTSASAMELTAPQKSSVKPAGDQDANQPVKNTTVARTAAPASDAVKLFSSAEVHAAFEKGSPLVAHDGRNYSVIAGRRDKPGQAELHEKDLDVIYVMQGSATFVTGGKMVDGKTTAPGEVRGTSIDGGETHNLSKDDVIIVPPGVPHWFKDVQGIFFYFVVKVQQP
jgi:quercetin dioxygenase-like cupin family protein